MTAGQTVTPGGASLAVESRALPAAPRGAHAALSPGNEAWKSQHPGWGVYVCVCVCARAVPLPWSHRSLGPHSATSPRAQKEAWSITCQGQGVQWEKLGPQLLSSRLGSSGWPGWSRSKNKAWANRSPQGRGKSSVCRREAWDTEGAPRPAPASFCARGGCTPSRCACGGLPRAPQASRLPRDKWPACLRAPVRGSGPPCPLKRSSITTPVYKSRRPARRAPLGGEAPRST